MDAVMADTDEAADGEGEGDGGAALDSSSSSDGVHGGERHSRGRQDVHHSSCPYGNDWVGGAASDAPPAAARGVLNKVLLPLPHQLVCSNRV
jgi:hypothetical protein